jgi:streptomycin 6-kinase
VTRPAASAICPPRPDPPARLRRLAARVESLGGSGRRDPEQQLIERQNVVEQLLDLAREMERTR